MRPASSAAALLALCVLLYLPPAVMTPFFTKGEPREGLVVRHMVEEGGWILPERASESGPTIASKPPFFHWLGALASRLAGGASELTVRLPSLALGTAAVLAVWLVGRAVLAPPAAFAAAVILATTFEWVRAVSTARVDGTLTALMTVGLLLVHRGFVRGGLTLPDALGAYLCFACAALTKGPVGFVLPGLILAVAVLVQGKAATVRRFHPVLGALLIGALVGGWYLAAARLGAEAFVEKHLLKENVFRFLGTSRLKSGHEHPFYYYFPTFAAGFLPWTPFLLAALVATARDARQRRDPRLAFLLAWVAVVFAFYSVASAKRSVYLLALYPAAALLTGHWWSSLEEAAHAPRWLRGRVAQGAVALVSAAVVLPLALVLLEGTGLAPLDRLAPLLHRKDQANLPIVRAIIDAHFALIVLGLAVVLGALVAALSALRRERWRRLFAASAVLATALWVIVFSVFQPELARERTLAPFLGLVAHRTAGEPVYFARGTFDFGAAFYAPPGTGPWRRDLRPAYLLVWDDGVSKLAAEGVAVEVLATSEGTDPKGTRHLTLVRVR